MKIISLIIGLVTGILLLSGLVFPMVSYSAAEDLTIKNTGAYFTTPDEGEHTIVITEHTITFDDKVCQWPDISYFGSIALMAGEDWCLRVDTYNPNTNNARALLAGPPHLFDVLLFIGPSYPNNTLTITISGDDVTFIPVVEGEASSERTREGLLYTIADKGSYVMSYKPYLLEDTPVFGSIRNNSNSANADIFENVSGTIGDVSNMTATALRLFKGSATPSTGDFTDNVFTADAENVTTNLYKLDKINQTLTLWDDSSTTLYLS